MPSRTKHPSSPPPTVYDRNVCAPDFFSVSLNRPGDAAAFVARATAFYEAMADLDRAVILHVSEDRKLYLSSIEQTIPPEHP